MIAWPIAPILFEPVTFTGWLVYNVKRACLDDFSSIGLLIKF